MMNTLLESYPPRISSTDILVNILFWGGTLLLYIFRENPIIKPIWRYYKLFIYVLLATLTINFIKDQWNKKK